MMKLKQFKGKKVNVIFKNNELVVGTLEKIPFLPVWRCDNKRFTKGKVRKIYLAKF